MTIIVARPGVDYCPIHNLNYAWIQTTSGRSHCCPQCYIEPDRSRGEPGQAEHSRGIRAFEWQQKMDRY